MSTTDHIVKHIHAVNARRELAEKMGVLPLVHELQRWQCQRLLKTHEDLAKQQKYQLAMGFFVEELYGPKDFSQRDADLARVIPKLTKVLPNKAMQALDDALALNALSFQLDMDLAQQLKGHKLDALHYAQAYRNSNEVERRREQIAIIEHLGGQLADVVNIAGISMLIKFARRPAKLAGLLALHEFLERGFNAFRKLGDVHAFIDPVIERERAIMNALFDETINLKTDNPIPHV